MSVSSDRNHFQRESIFHPASTSLSDGQTEVQNPTKPTAEVHKEKGVHILLPGVKHSNNATSLYSCGSTQGCDTLYKIYKVLANRHSAYHQSEHPYIMYMNIQHVCVCVCVCLLHACALHPPCKNV